MKGVRKRDKKDMKRGRQRVTAGEALIQLIKDNDRWVDKEAGEEAVAA